jgi:hypothetical protein
MTTDNIPKSFWHSISASVLIFTIGFTWVGYKAGNLTVKYKDFEMVTAAATNQVAEAKTALEGSLKLAAQSEELEKENRRLNGILAKTREQVEALKGSKGASSGNEIAKQIEALTEDFRKKTDHAEAASVPKPGFRISAQSQLEQMQLRVDKLGEIQKDLQKLSDR